MVADAGRVGAIRRTEDREGRTGGRAGGHVLERARGDDRRRDRQRRSAGRQIGRDHELRENAGRLARLRIDGIHAGEVDHGTGLDSAGQCGNGNRRTHLVGAGDVGAGNRLRTIDVRCDVLIHRIRQTERINHDARSELLC